MNTRYGHVTYTKLGIRHSTLQYFCRDFNIDIAKYTDNGEVNKDVRLQDNFVFFLLENKTFIQLYNLDYYSNKTIEIIANKIGRKENEIIDYLNDRKYKIDPKYPYRYISSYRIDYELGSKYTFLTYKADHIYEGNFELRRRSLEGNEFT